MKVLQVTTHMNVGGISKYVLSISKAMKALGVETAVVSSGGELEGSMAGEGIKHYRAGLNTKFEFNPKIIAAALTIAGIARREKADIIHAHSRVSQLAAAIASRITGIAYVTTCHGYFLVRSRKLIDTWGRRVIAISDAVSEHLSRDLGVGSDRIRVVYSGVDIEKYSRRHSKEERDGLKRSIGLKDGPIVGTIGRLSPVKGQEFFIRAFAKVVARKKDAQALIVGDGQDENMLKALSRELGIEGSVNFAGTSQDTRAPLSIIDIFVLPSVKEGLGLALLEALAAGKPCVASKIGGIPDIIQDGTNGILTHVGASDQIAAAVLKLLDNPALGMAMGEKGRELVKKRFCLDAMAGNTLRVYEEVVGSREN